MKTLTHFALAAATLLWLAACGAGAPTEPVAEQTAPPPTETVTQAPPTETEIPTAPAPIPVTFQSADGTTLQGTYYPPIHAPAPVVVLIHWVAGSERDWDAIAPWLQKAETLPPVTVENTYWLDWKWFPAVPETLNVGVFAFSLRDCNSTDGCAEIYEAEWIADTLAALQTASSQPGADPAKMVTIGASIGADAAFDGCLAFNRAGAGACVGALALSPGNYLGQSIEGTITASLEEFPHTLNVCMADEGELPVCSKPPAGEFFEVVQVEPRGHGMILINPEAKPNVLEYMLDFIGRATR